jgi:hypothetical protein
LLTAVLSFPVRGELREPDALRIADLLEGAGVKADKSGEIKYGDGERYITLGRFTHEFHYQLQI